MSDSRITIENGKVAVRTGDLCTTFASLESAAEQIALLHDGIGMRKLFDREKQAEVERLTRERDALLACRQGDQRCHECPDTECADNTIEATEVTRLREENADLRQQLIDAGVWEESGNG